MSIASELTNLQQDITNARAKIVEKGGTITSGGGSSQLATDIGTIQNGGWKRPSDYPDLDSLTIPSGWVGAYATIVSTTEATNEFSMWASLGTISVGHIDNGQFVAENTYNSPTYNYVSVQLNGIKVVKIEPTSQQATDVRCFIKSYGLVEACLYGMNGINLPNSTKSLIRLKFDRVIGLNSDFTFQAFNVLESIEMYNCILNDNANAGRGMFQGLECLSYLKVKDCAFPSLKSCNNIITYVKVENFDDFDLSELDFSNVTNFYGMFSYLTQLRKLDLSNITFPSTLLNNATNFMVNCKSLYDFYPPSNVFNKSFSFSTCPILSKESLIRIIDSLVVVGTTQTLTLGTTLMNKLTSAEIQVAIDKGWSVA